MTTTLSHSFSAFEGQRLLHSGPLFDVALAVKAAAEKEPDEAVLVFDDANGRVVDLDLRGSDAEIAARLEAQFGTPEAASNGESEPAPRKRGRPKLGVVAREVTLLPKQWDWLADQPGGASATLRRLVNEARRNGGSESRMRAAREAAYNFMSAMAGDFPGFEEASRALFADDLTGMKFHMEDWPGDVRDHVIRLATPPESPAL